MFLILYPEMTYENTTLSDDPKNKPNSNPKKSQSNPNRTLYSKGNASFLAKASPIVYDFPQRH